MAKQRQEDVLDNVIGGRCAEIERSDVAPNARTALVEQSENLLFDRNRSDRRARNESRRERQLDHVLKFLCRHLARLEFYMRLSPRPTRLRPNLFTVNKRRAAGIYEIEAVSVASSLEVWT